MGKDPPDWASLLSQKQPRSFPAKIWIKIAFWFFLWAMTWVAVIFAPVSGAMKFFFALIHILTHPFIALNVGHDANHNAITDVRWLGAILMRSFDLIGISSWCWRLNHNRLHHPYTSVAGVDTTADGKKILRLNRTERCFLFHRFQHIYAPFPYGLVTLNYVFLRDLRDFFRLWRASDKNRYVLPFIECVAFKLLYVVMEIILPVLLLPYSPLSIVGTFLLAHFLLGQIIILIQVPHFNLKTLPVSETDIPKERAEEFAFVLKHTTDMAPRSRFWNWLLGGTNTHAIHHLFPGVSHTEYRHMTDALMKFCEENNLRYTFYESVTESYLSHYRYLKYMGKENINGST